MSIYNNLINFAEQIGKTKTDRPLAIEDMIFGIRGYFPKQIWQ